MALDIRKFTNRFVDEARDHLRRIEDGLATLRTHPGDTEALHAIFRSAHTIKGSSRMLKLGPISETAHKLEDVLGAIRDGSLAWTPHMGRLVQRGIDAIAAQVDCVADGRELVVAEEALFAALTSALTSAFQGEPAPSPDKLSPPFSASTPGEMGLKSAETVRIQLSKLDDLIKLMGEVVSSHQRLHQRLTDVKEIGRMVSRDHQIGLSEANASIKAFAHDLHDDVFDQELLMEELHSKALVMRMLPLSLVFEPAARLVRDLGLTLGKEVECVTAGLDIELDRQLIDRLGDTIVHLLRNAVDHGLETPDARVAAGKPRYGRLSLSAHQDGGRLGGLVVVEVADDGTGLPLAAIRDKAVRKGLVSAEQAAALPESELVDMIFRPGFSTSSLITDVSGRGVGMDAVKRCVVDDLQGVIEVKTITGKGATFSLRLPLSLAVMRVLLVLAGNQTFGFTAQHATNLLSVSDDDILTVAERRVVVIQNEFVPMLDLAELLSLPTSPINVRMGNVRMGNVRMGAKGKNLLVVLRVRNERLALRVDDLLDEHDMVIKPLPEHIRYLSLVAGMVTSGRNTLVSILHAPALLENARIMRSERLNAATTTICGTRVLVVDDSLNTREIEKDVLEAHGYQVTLAEDGMDGLQKARAGTFDAILTDVEMPNMDGFTLTAALRNLDRYQHVPIIIITSREKEEDKRRGIQVGADAYIVKGDFNQSNLVSTLQALLG